MTTAVLGLLAVQQQRGAHFLPAGAMVLAVLAALLGLLVLARLSRTARGLRAALEVQGRETRAAESVASAGGLLLAGVDRAGVHRAALRALLHVVPADVERTGVALALGPAQLLELVAADGRGLSPEDVGRVDLSVLDDDDRRSLATGREVWRHVGAADRVFVLPLTVPGRQVGVLVVAALSRDLEALAPSARALAPQLALAVEGARLREAAARTGRDAGVLGPGAQTRMAVAMMPGLVAELTRALRERELVVHYQPIVALTDGRPTGFEALVRWQHPRRGLLSPDQFLEQVEESGLLGQLDTAVMATACRQAVAWDPSSTGPYVSVNVSAQQLLDVRLVAQVRSTLVTTGLPPWRLLMELTETAAVRDPAAVASVLARLRAMKVRVAFDDFGTGYSSLSWLQQLPLDLVKIDKSFVDRLPQPAAERPVVEALVRMAQTMRLEVVAEGIETEAQREALTAMGVRYGQGWLFSRALPAAQAGALLPVRRSRPGDPQHRVQVLPGARGYAVVGSVPNMSGPR